MKGGICEQLLIAILLSISTTGVWSKPWSDVSETDPSHCKNAGMSCGGHSYDSCSQYCVSNGYLYGQCEDSCCMCYYQVSSMALATQEDTDLEQKYKTSNPVLFVGGTDVNDRESLRRNSNRNRKLIQDRSSSSYKGNQQDVCTTPACTEAAEELKANLDPSVNPCDNFYQFACGGFLERTDIPNDATSVSTFSLGERKVAQQVRAILEEPQRSGELKPFQLTKAFYKSCMNKDMNEHYGVSPLKTLLKQLGGWPVVDGVLWEYGSFHWAEASIAFRKVGLSASYFMSFSVNPDVHDSSKRVISIGEPALGLDRNVFIKGIGDPVVRAYYKFQTELAVLLGADRFDAEKQMLDALEFELNLSSIFMTPSGKRSINSFYNPMTIAQLQLKYPSINWFNYIQRLMPSNVRIDLNEVIVVHSPTYIEKFLKLIATTPTRVQANYLMWRAAAASVPYLNEESRRIHTEFSTAILGKVQRQPRTKECIDAVSSVMGNAIGAMYIRHFFKEEAKATAQEMVDDIGMAFMDLLDEATWMDARTRQTAKEKAWAMKSHIGYPQEHRDDKFLNQFYNKFEISKNQAYLLNILKITRQSTDWSFGRLRSPVNKTEWINHGRNAVVNAFYHPQENSISFPAAILQGHFFDNDRPRYMNYGAIGWIIGHEITHGFDMQGHQYDKNGDFRDWWDPRTKITYDTKTKCFVEQYGAFVAKDVQLRLNGENSQGENVADNGGIKEAYRGYQAWVKRSGIEKGLPGLKYTPNQLFWITAANNWCNKMRPAFLRHSLSTGVHAPGEFRVLGTFANSKEFATDFQCPRNSRMNPDSKCSLW